MSTRERWIVYPLLFLTLGIAMRGTQWKQESFTADKITVRHQLDAATVRCHRLEVIDGGWIETYGKDGAKAVSLGAQAADQSGVVETFDAAGVSQVRLHSTENGGRVTTLGHGKRVSVIMGHNRRTSGVFALIPQLKQTIPLTWPWRFDTLPAPGETPAGEPSAEKRPCDDSAPEDPDSPDEDPSQDAPKASQR